MKHISTMFFSPWDSWYGCPDIKDWKKTWLQAMVKVGYNKKTRLGLSITLFRHSLDPGCWCLQGSQFFRRLVTHVWFWSGFPTHDRLRASGLLLLPLRDFTSLVVTHVVPRKNSLALILEELLLYTLLGACHGVQVMIETAMGRVTLPNRMIFRKTSKGEGVIFNPKIYIADFGNIKQGFLSMKLIQTSNFRAQGMFFSLIV